MQIAAIIPAAGQGTRLKTKIPKAFVTVAGKPLFIHTLLALKKSQRFSQTVIAIESALVSKAAALIKRHGLNTQVVAGGATRAESVYLALQAVSDDCKLVLVHDAARPLVSAQTVRQTISEAAKTGAALCAWPATATVKRVNPETKQVLGTEDRNTLYLAQTPQVFYTQLLKDRYKRLGAKAYAATDEAALFDGSRTSVKVVTGEAKNIKITTREDLEIFKAYLRRK